MFEPIPESQLAVDKATEAAQAVETSRAKKMSTFIEEASDKGIK